MPEINWEAVERQLLIGYDPATRKRRQAWFEKLDQTKTKKLTFTQVQNGISPLLDRNFPLKDHRAALKCAYQASKDLSNTSKSIRRGGGDVNIDQAEFHALLIAFRHYLELAVLFSVIDSGQDKRLSFKKCEKKMALLNSWGLEKQMVRNRFPADEWADTMKFEDFADWCIAKKMGQLGLDLDDEDNEKNKIEDAAEALRHEGGVTDGSGGVGRELENIQNERKIMECFNKWDADGSGTISKEELCSVMSGLDPGLTPEKLELLFSAADKDSNGVLDVREFTQWLFRPAR